MLPLLGVVKLDRRTARDLQGNTGERQMSEDMHILMLFMFVSIYMYVDV
jgi:hypothetical protein